MALLAALVVIVMGWIFPSMTVKGIAISTLGCVLIVIAALPMRWSLFFCLVYIGFEGFLKIISDYNPVVHVGSDVLIILLCLRVLAKAFARGNPMPRYAPPLMALFIFHFVWVVITLFNPYSLGVIPSIAGSKIYVTMPLLFFFGYYLCETIEDFHFFIRGFIFVAIVHTGFGLYQAMIGPESVLSLHPRYAIQLEKYKNTAFRPFGLTNLPGGPAVYLVPVLPLTMYFAFQSKPVWRLALLGFCASAISLVLLCQVRSALLKVMLGMVIFAIGWIAVTLRSPRKKRMGLGTMAIATVVLVFAVPKLVTFSIANNEENKIAIERSLSLFDVDKISRARTGITDRFLAYAQKVPFGAGFSRVGASAGAFQGAYDDPYFKPYYFFADNFWIACLVEVGIPGMIVLTMIIFFIIFRGFRVSRQLQKEEHKLAAYALLAAIVPLVVGLYGAEGILYNPDASFFWLLSGILLKLPKMESLEAPATPATTDEIFLESDYRA